MSKVNYKVKDETLSRFEEILGEEFSLSEQSILVCTTGATITGYVAQGHPKIISGITKDDIINSKERIDKDDKVYIAPGYVNEKGFIEQCIKDAGAKITGSIKVANKVVFNQRIFQDAYTDEYFKQYVHLVSGRLPDSNRFNASYSWRHDNTYVAPLFIDLVVAVVDNGLTIVNEGNLQRESFLDLSDNDKLDMYAEMYKSDSNVFLRLLTSSSYEKEDYYKLYKLLKKCGISGYILNNQKFTRVFYNNYKFIIDAYGEMDLIDKLYKREILTPKMFSEILEDRDILKEIVRGRSNYMVTIKSAEFNENFLNKLKENESKLI